MKRIIIIVIAVLVVLIGVTAFLNAGNVQEKRLLNEDAVFIIMEQGEEKKQFDMAAIRVLGETEFETAKDTSTTGPEKQTYTGVLLKKLYEAAGVAIESGDAVLNVAADGYTVMVTGEKVLEDDNVYIVYIKDGEPIGTREDGGDGPYLIVISNDKFSQNWCKYALSSELIK